MNNKLKETKPVNFNGGFIKASQEARELLKKDGKIIEFNYQTIPDNDVHFLVSENGKNFMKVNKDQLYGYQKQFYINNGELSWNEPELTFRESTAHAICEQYDVEKLMQINSMEDELTYKEHTEAREELPIIQKRHFKILKCQIEALECSLKATRELKRFYGLNLDLSKIEREIVIVLAAIEDLENDR